MYTHRYPSPQKCEGSRVLPRAHNNRGRVESWTIKKVSRHVRHRRHDGPRGLAPVALENPTGVSSVCPLQQSTYTGTICHKRKTTALTLSRSDRHMQTQAGHTSVHTSYYSMYTVSNRARHCSMRATNNSHYLYTQQRRSVQMASAACGV